MCTFSFLIIIGVTFNKRILAVSFDYRLIIPEGKFRSSRVGDRVSERSNNGDIVVLSFILYRNIKFVQIIIRNNIVTIMDDN